LTVGGSDKPRGSGAWKVGVGTGGGWGGLEGAGVPIELELAGARILQCERHGWRRLDFHNRRRGDRHGDDALTVVEAAECRPFAVEGGVVRKV